MNNKTIVSLSAHPDFISKIDRKKSSNDNGGNDGGNSMLERIKKLEEETHKLSIDLAVIKSNYSTKQDVESIKSELHKTISAQTKWVVGSIFIALGAGLTIAKLLFL